MYALTNNRTWYQAEAIAYSLQVFHRGTIIGEQQTTMGWANAAPMWFHICEKEFGNGWWSVYVENRKLVHEVTKASWEGVGVKSDITPDFEKGGTTVDAREVALAFEKNKWRNFWEEQEEL